MLHSPPRMSPRLTPLRLVTALALTLAAGSARAQAPGLAMRVEQQLVPGSPVRRASVVADYPAPFPRVAAQLLNYSDYPVFLRRFRSARVIHRDRAQTDVYFDVDLPEALGRFWFLHRMTVTRRPDLLIIDGVSREGNAGLVETHVELRRTPTGCRFTFSLYALPTIPALPESVSQLLRRAVEDGAQSLLRVAQTP